MCGVDSIYTFKLYRTQIKCIVISETDKIHFQLAEW